MGKPRAGGTLVAGRGFPDNIAGGDTARWGGYAPDGAARGQDGRGRRSAGWSRPGPSQTGVWARSTAAALVQGSPPGRMSPVIAMVQGGPPLFRARAPREP